MRYITIPEPVRIVNPLTKEPYLVPDGKGGTAQEVFSFAKSCAIAILVASQKGSADAIKLDDLQTQTDDAVVGSILALDDAQWALLEAEFARPNASAFGGYWARGGGMAHVRAWLDALKVKPAVLVKVPSDVAAAAG